MSFTCFFCSRQSLRSLINNLNVQKATIKKKGMKVDGKKYNIRFTGKPRVKVK